ncbi:hypothetical protein PYCCODRAFT_209265 [Trametes coccinea BRFM310]|uniref:Uncharacterized protein n=1 Tax=Trametes coccinea (strain BRFM310) TaxID=1353009 RepID=A0A1Y2ITW5_TRAC3|nr:hypothetical protein PYCCODRAFT_209265 [Trametes coccinea BRFM310]
MAVGTLRPSASSAHAHSVRLLHLPRARSSSPSAVFFLFLPDHHVPFVLDSTMPLVRPSSLISTSPIPVHLVPDKRQASSVSAATGKSSAPEFTFTLLPHFSPSYCAFRAPPPSPGSSPRRILSIILPLSVPQITPSCTYTLHTTPGGGRLIALPYAFPVRIPSPKRSSFHPRPPLHRPAVGPTYGTLPCVPSPTADLVAACAHTDGISRLSFFSIPFSFFCLSFSACH